MSIAAETTLGNSTDWLPGTWHIRAKHSLFQIQDAGTIRATSHATISDWIGEAILENACDLIAGSYALANTDTESSQKSVEFRFHLRLEPTAKVINGVFADEAHVSAQIGRQLPDSLHFVSEFHDSCIFWRPFAAVFPELSDR